MEQVWEFGGIAYAFDEFASLAVMSVSNVDIGDGTEYTFNADVLVPLPGDAVARVEQIVLDQVASDITIGGDPVMGGGARYRTFYRDLTR